MQLSPATTTYRAPDWGVPAAQRAQLRGLVTEALTDFEPVAVTHDSDEDMARRIREGFRVRDNYREQLEYYGTVDPGEDLADTVFASLQFRPRGSSEPVFGVERYGDVVFHWSHAPLEHARITPILSGHIDQAKLFGGRLRAGTLADLPDIVTDALIAQHGDTPLELGTRTWLPDLLAQPHDQARAAVAALLTAPEFHNVSPEVILRGATATRQAVEAVTILSPKRSPELDQVRAWAAREGVPLRERPNAEK
jgi:hypothetical protein